MKHLFKKIICALTAFSIAAPTWAAIPTSTREYDAAGQTSAVVEGNGQRHTLAYNAWGDVTTYRPPSPTTPGYTLGYVALGYGRVHRPVGITDQRGLTTTYTYGGHTRLLSGVTSPDAGHTGYVYDSGDNLKQMTTPMGATVNYTYDDENRPLTANYGDSSVSLSYYSGGAGDGQPSAMTDASGTTGWTYDLHGRPTSRTQAVTAGGAFTSQLTLSQAWSAGRVTQMTYPSGAVVSYTYDGDNVASIQVNGVTVISNVTYEPMGPVSGWTMGNVGSYSRVFDTAGRVTSHTYEGGQRTLTWDASNRPTAIANPDGSQWTYLYDGANRLKNSNEPAVGIRTYALDSVANRTSLSTGGIAYSTTVDSTSNRLSSATGPGFTNSYQFDAAGRVIGDGTRTFAWNNAGQLVSATNGAQSAAYAYNGQGNRVRKVVAGAARHYFYADDGVSLLGEYTQANAGAPVAVLNEVVYLDGLPVAVMRGGSVYFIQPDHLGTPRLIRNAAGAVVWRWASDPYGVGQPDQNPGGVSLFEFNSRMPGQQFDVETGLFYNNARYYDPTVGRYISSDPIGLAGGINTYGYAGAQPLSATDANGEFFWIVAQGAFIAWNVFEVGSYLHKHFFSSCAGANRESLRSDTGWLLAGFTPFAKIAKVAKAVTREARWLELANAPNTRLPKEVVEHINRHGGQGVSEKFGLELAHPPRRAAAQGFDYAEAQPKWTADHRGIEHRYLRESRAGTTINTTPRPRNGGKFDVPPEGALP